MTTTTHPQLSPPLVSLPRVTTLIASLLVSLGSGSKYAYSAYSPQLGSRLGISHTQLNVVALSGNLGVYISAPLWGKIVDSRGPRTLLGFAFTFLLTGYTGMRYLYNTGLPDGVLHLSKLGFFLLAAFCLLTGAGGSAGWAASVNATAKTFPDQVRATTTGLVISGFGLSAFFFSNVAHFFFPGDTSALFLVLALGTSSSMMVGFFLVRPIPLEREGYHDVGSETQVAITSESARLLHHHKTSNTHLLDNDTRHHDHVHYYSSDEGRHGREIHPNIDQRNSIRNSNDSNNDDLEPTHDNLPNLHGKTLFTSMDFWILSSILSILAGTGLMYINNVGAMSRALYAHNTHQYDDAKAAGWQTAQVSTFSLTNFLGRIFIGTLSDFWKSRYGMPRSYGLVLVSSLFCISQLMIAATNDIKHLWLASSVLGLAYGGVYSIFPTLCIERFGMPHFSENWGFMLTSPIAGGNIFSFIFGRNLDAHENPPGPYPVPGISSNLPPKFPAATTLSAPLCLEGKNCYVDTIYLTAFITFLSVLLSLWAGYHDRKRMMAY